MEAPVRLEIARQMQQQVPSTVQPVKITKILW